MTSGPSVIPATKLHIPSVRAGIVSRDELVGLLVRGGSRKLTLLNAPAGFGKTALLAQCARRARAGAGERPVETFLLTEHVPELIAGAAAAVA